MSYKAFCPLARGPVSDLPVTRTWRTFKIVYYDMYFLSLSPFLDYVILLRQILIFSWSNFFEWSNAAIIFSWISIFLFTKYLLQGEQVFLVRVLSSSCELPRRLWFQPCGRVNHTIKKDVNKVVDTVDIEDITDKAVFCRCWRSENVSSKSYRSTALSTVV